MDLQLPSIKFLPALMLVLEMDSIKLANLQQAVIDANLATALQVKLASWQVANNLTGARICTIAMCRTTLYILYK